MSGDVTRRADAAFDVVASVTMIEFVSDVRAALAEMARCAKSGGGILVGTLNRLDPLNLRRLAEGEEPYRSSRMFSPDELRVLLSPFGEVRMVGIDDGARADTPGGALIVAEVTR